MAIQQNLETLSGLLLTTQSGVQLVTQGFVGGATTPGGQSLSGGRIQLNPKFPSEDITYEFPFLRNLAAGESILSVTMSSRVYSGVDALAGNLVLGYSPTISGTSVWETIVGGQPGVIYIINCEATTSNGQVIEISGFLAVLSDDL